MHCLPQTPKNAGALKECVELKAGEDYLLDGRVKNGKIGCSWKADGIDVDASLAVYDGNHKCLDVIWWDKTHSHYVSAKHLHDDRDGKAVEGTDVNEIIAVSSILRLVQAAAHMTPLGETRGRSGGGASHCGRGERLLEREDAQGRL